MSTWVPFVGIALVLAAVLAIVVTSLVIAVCLVVAWITDAVREPSERGARGQGGARTTMPSSPDGRRRNASEVPVASRRGDWRGDY
jgi:hypothetical protein